VWDSKFSLGLNDLCLNRHRLAVLVWDPISSDLIDRMNLRLRVTRAEHGESVPGVLQFTAAADLKRVNKVLRDLIRPYQWESMPEAIRYSQFDLTFETQGDLVVNRGPLLTIGGVYFTDGRIATGADLRLHLRPSRGDHASVRDLIEMLRSFQ